MDWKINKIKGHHYEERAIIGDGHTMFLNDVLKALKRKEYLEAENKELKEGIKKAIGGLKYSGFNLTRPEKFENLVHESEHRVVESTCPEITLLIEIRDLVELTEPPKEIN